MIGEYIYCGFWRRFGAMFIDVTILMLIGTLVFFLLPTQPYILLILLYFPIFESSSMQATPGCYVLDMKIINKDGTPIGFLKSCVRAFTIYLISSILLWLIVSTLCAIFTKNNEKMFIHDQIFRTRMVER
ncbi:MAG: RDD family protein [Rickettsia endosymbiont of Gnoriste bilineata]|nr:RDD family protein [Rickettsia endosymbiont of Gnoriste bilineata]